MRRWGSVVALAGALLAACQPHIDPIAPADLPPISNAVVQSWVNAVAPRHAVRYDLVWHFENKQGNTAGRASARIAPPDSLRFDYRAPFGHSGAAVVLGDSARWARPQADISGIMPAAPLLWIALGAPQAPAPDATTYGQEKAGWRVWRISRGGETMDVVFEPGAPAHLRAQWRRGAMVIGVCDVTLVGGRPTKAVLTFPDSGSRFTFSVDATDTLVTLDPAIWSPPR
jgi:hypothetical protein